MAHRVVCISRAVGAGGEEVARIVAASLGLRYVDEEIVARAAAKGGVEPGAIADVEQRKTLLARLLDEVAEGSAGEAYAFAGLVPSFAAEKSFTSDELRALIRDALAETAAQGDVAIVAHAASHALAGKDGVLRVLVTASPETRARRLAERAGIDAKEAAKAIKDSDAARADYLRRFYDVKAEVPTHYDLVVNTDALGLDRAAAVIAQAAGR